MKRWRVPLGACVLGASLALAALPVGSASATSRTALAPRVTSPADGSNDTGFDAATLDGAVGTILVQPDGKILIKSAYSGFSGGLKRLNADGTLDNTFTSAYTNGNKITAIALQADGKILLGVDTRTDGIPYGTKGLVRLNSDGTEDGSFAPTEVNQPTCNVSTPCIAPTAITVQVDGKILISVSRNPKPLAIRLNPDGSKDDSFAIPPGTLGSPGYESMPDSFELQADGKILIAGPFPGKIKRLNSDGTVDTGFTFDSTGFYGYGGVMKALPNGKVIYTKDESTLVRLNYDGTPDGTFTPPALVVGYHAPIVTQADGKILIGGDASFARLNPDGTIDGTFTPPTFTNSVGAYAVQTDGKIVVSAAWPDYIIRLNNTGPDSSDGTLDLAFSANLPALDDTVLTSAVQADGKILIGGRFTGGLKRLNADGTEDTGFNSAVGANVWQIVVLSDGKILVFGSFTGNLKRLKSDGSEDSGFTPAVTGSILGVQIDGKVLVAGSFAGYLKRLNADGTEDTGFTPPALDDFVYVGALQADGKILIGGIFTGYLKRLNPDGTIDGTFTPPAFDGDLMSLTVQPNGKILIGGFFTGHLKRLNYDGSNDDGFTPPALDGWNESQQTIAVQADGKIVIGGYFTGYLLRLNADGTLDAPLPARPSRLAAERDGRIQANAFTPPSFSGGVNSVLILPDGSILVGGVFAGHLVRLGASGATPPPVLPPTGADTTVLVVFAVILLAAGTVLVTSRRRKIALR